MLRKSTGTTPSLPLELYNVVLKGESVRRMGELMLLWIEEAASTDAKEKVDAE